MAAGAYGKGCLLHSRQEGESTSERLRDERKSKGDRERERGRGGRERNRQTHKEQSLIRN